MLKFYEAEHLFSDHLSSQLRYSQTLISQFSPQQLSVVVDTQDKIFCWDTQLFLGELYIKIVTQMNFY